MKTLRLRTPIEKNGNVYQLEVDLNNKKYARGYFLFWSSDDDVVAGKNQLIKLSKQFETNGFEKVDKI